MFWGNDIAAYYTKLVFAAAGILFVAGVLAGATVVAVFWTIQ